MSDMNLILEEMQRAAGLAEAKRPKSPTRKALAKAKKYLESKKGKIEEEPGPSGTSFRVSMPSKQASESARADIDKLFKSMGMERFGVAKVTYPAVGYGVAGASNYIYMEWDRYGYIGLLPSVRR